MSQLVALMWDPETGRIVSPDGVAIPLDQLGQSVPLIDPETDLINTALLPSIELPENVVLTDAEGLIDVGVLPAAVVLTGEGGRIAVGVLPANVVLLVGGKIPPGQIPLLAGVALHANEDAATAAMANLTGNAIAFFGTNAADVYCRARIGEVFSSAQFQTF